MCKTIFRFFSIFLFYLKSKKKEGTFLLPCPSNPDRFHHGKDIIANRSDGRFAELCHKFYDGAPHDGPITDVRHLRRLFGASNPKANSNGLV